MIPFFRATHVGTEQSFIEECLAEGRISGDGPFTKKCQTLLESALGAPRARLTTSCTHALEMSALLLDVEPGDEVIVPSFAFVSTANAFALRGARIVFADIRPDTLNIDETKLRALVTSRTKAIVLLHYAGVACEMDEIQATADEFGVAVVEDNAHGLFGAYKGRMLGTLGAYAAHSFHETKNITCGEGGMLSIMRAESFERAEVVWQKGTDRTRFNRGEVARYTWRALGSSFPPSDVLAAYLYAQLLQRGGVQEARRVLWHQYFDGLRDWATHAGVILPMVPDHCEQTYQLFYMLLPSQQDRDALIFHLRDRGIGSASHYMPLHDSDVGHQHGGYRGQCPVSESSSERLIRLPLFTSMTRAGQLEVIDATTRFRPIALSRSM